MLSKLSIKTKIIIFSAAAVIGIGIVVSVGIDNRRASKNFENINNAEIRNVQKK